MHLFLKNTFFQFLNQIFSRLISAVSGIIIIRSLSKEDYGLFAIIMAFVGGVNLVSNLGFPTMIIKSLSQYYERERSKAVSYWRFNFKVYGLLTLVFALIYLAVSPLIAKIYHLPQAAPLFRLSVPLFILFALFSFYEWTFTGLNQFKPFWLKVLLPREILSLIFVILFLGLGLRISAPILAQIAAGSAGLLVAVALAGRRLRGPGTAIDQKWILRGAWNVAPANLAYASTVYMDIIIIGALLATPLLASYRVCLAVVMMAVGLFPVGAFILPTLSAMKREEAVLFLNDVVKATVIVALPVMFFIASFSMEVIGLLFGEKYIEASPLLSLFIFVLLGRFIVSIFVGAMSFMERFKAMSGIWAVTAFLNIVFLYFFTKFIGTTGAVIATLILYYLLSIAMGWDIVKQGLKISGRPLVTIFLIGSVLALNLILKDYLPLSFRILLLIVTGGVYGLLLKVGGIFASINLFQRMEGGVEWEKNRSY